MTVTMLVPSTLRQSEMCAVLRGNCLCAGTDGENFPWVLRILPQVPRILIQLPSSAGALLRLQLLLPTSKHHKTRMEVSISPRCEGYSIAIEYLEHYGVSQLLTTDIYNMLLERSCEDLSIYDYL